MSQTVYLENSSIKNPWYLLSFSQKVGRELNAFFLDEFSSKTACVMPQSSPIDDWMSFPVIRSSSFPRNLTIRVKPDVGGQYCPCPILVSFLSRFSGKSYPVSVRCQDYGRIFCPSVKKAVSSAGQGRDGAIRTFGPCQPTSELTVMNLSSNQYIIHFRCSSLERSYCVSF